MYWFFDGVILALKVSNEKFGTIPLSGCASCLLNVLAVWDHFALLDGSNKKLWLLTNYSEQLWRKESDFLEENWLRFAVSTINTSEVLFQWSCRSASIQQRHVYYDIESKTAKMMMHLTDADGLNPPKQAAKHQGLLKALKEKQGLLDTMSDDEKEDMLEKAHSAIANTRCWGLAATAPPARSAPPTAGLSSSATRTSSPSSASPPPPTAGFPSRPIKHLPSQPHRSKTGRTTNLASCIVATVFLLFLAVGIVVVYYFLLFKPKDPKIAVDVVQFPTFSVANGIVDFTFLQYVTVSNPNRDAFTHYDSSLQLAYSDAPLSAVSVAKMDEVDGLYGSA
ncbi:hypothetical protein RJ640_017007 [Escallonia rubra]|uniref:Late embryogenesis abundant protein LEA-2 subgroup domain-containing protein n=1 Tax=Escallonia rubra TaxID=112253 RepID=A0AA88R5H3_9ASTE|nr:hypothetical protein RJ640_017007 [Escallonia rubra]